MNTIQLDYKWRIENDAYSFKLISSEERQREKLDKKRKPTGEFEDYTHEDSWYYPTLSMCLKRYVNEAVKEQDSVNSIIERLDHIEQKIDEIKLTFKK